MAETPEGCSTLRRSEVETLGQTFAADLGRSSAPNPALGSS
ncbi:hypothetical protein [Mesorhizobium sp. Cs1299R1N3]